MFTNFAIGDFSTVDLLIILAVVLLLFGAKKLPELSRSVGQSMRELRKGMSDSGDDEKKKNDNNQAQSGN
jgi:sec-independent protein translocase protein TatA